MRTAWVGLVLVALIATGCSLAEDITPPPALESAQTLQPPVPAGASETPMAPTGPGAGVITPGNPEARPTETPPGASGGPTPTALGSIQGRAVNGTAGSTVPAGIEVTLHALDGDADTIVGMTVAGADGGFSFEGLDTSPGRLYFATATYQGLEFETLGAHFLADRSAPLELTLTLYETNPHRSAAQVRKMHLIILSPTPGTVRISEVWVLSNSGDRVIVLPQGESLLNVALPLGAVLVDVQSSSSDDVFVDAGQGFGYSSSLLPGNGTAEMAVTYDVAFPGRLTLTQTLDIPVESIVILTDQAGFTIHGPGIAEAEPVSMGTASLRQFAAGPFPAGAQFQVTVSGAGRFPWDMVLGATLFLAAGLAVRLWWLRRQPPAGEATRVVVGPAPAEKAPLEREILLRSIAALDDDFAAGRVPEAEYRARREDLKRRALATMQARDD